jgi:hypothetical protein
MSHEDGTRQHALARSVPRKRSQISIEKESNMTKKTVKSLLMTAAVSGLMTGGAVTLNAQSAPSSNQTAVRSASVASLLQADDKSKHACKGQNDCKGQGGCKSGDNGCKGKNSCKGKGGCATDGSKMPE